jgi:hypothetical protein
VSYVAKLESDHGPLLITFQYHGRRCREYLGLKDTREDRRAATVTVREIEQEMASGKFDYAVLTIVMGLPGMTPIKAGSGLGVVWCAGYMGAFFSPIVDGSRAGHFWLADCDVGFALFGLIAIGGFYMVPETGGADNPTLRTSSTKPVTYV